jgi:hypothetical protein
VIFEDYERRNSDVDETEFFLAGKVDTLDLAIPARKVPVCGLASCDFIVHGSSSPLPLEKSPFSHS